MLRFYRFRHMWASGWSSWEFGDIDSDLDWDKLAKGIAEEKGEENSWSDMFRRTEVELLKEPPKEYVLSMIESIECGLKFRLERLKQFKELASGWTEW